MERPEGLVSIGEILHYLEQDRYLSFREAAAYLSMGPKMLGEILPEQLRFRLSARKILIRKSELDEFMNQFRELPQNDLERIAEDAVERVLRK